MHEQLWGWFCLGILVLLGSPGSSWAADLPTPGAPDSDFDKLILRIRAAAENGRWRAMDWTDEIINESCKKIIRSVNATTNSSAWALPVEIQAVKPSPAGRPPNFASNSLSVISGELDVPFAAKSVFLIDGSIRIAHASDCLVIARGIIEIAHANNCFVVAGHHVNISHDGNGGFAPRGPGQTPPGGSVVISGGSIAISHAAGTVCCAPQFVDISHATGVTFIASPKREIGDRGNCNFYDKAPMPLTIPAPQLLSNKVFTVKQVVAPDDHSKQLISVQRNGIEYVLRPGSKIIDEKGQPITGWENWSLAFVTEEVALFSDGKSDASVHVK